MQGGLRSFSLAFIYLKKNHFVRACCCFKGTHVESAFHESLSYCFAMSPKKSIYFKNDSENYS